MPRDMAAAGAEGDMAPQASPDAGPGSAGDGPQPAGDQSADDTAEAEGRGDPGDAGAGLAVFAPLPLATPPASSPAVADDAATVAALRGVASGLSRAPAPLMTGAAAEPAAPAGGQAASSADLRLVAGAEAPPQAIGTAGGEADPPPPGTSTDPARAAAGPPNQGAAVYGPVPIRPQVPVPPPEVQPAASPGADAARAPKDQMPLPVPQARQHGGARPGAMLAQTLTEPAAPPDPAGAAAEGVPDMAPLSAAAAAPIPAPGPAAPAVAPSQLAPVIVMAATPTMSAGAPPGPADITVTLSPAELGTLHLRVSSEGDALRVTILADRADTLDLMRRHGDQLLDDLRSLGFGGATLGFGTSGGGQAAPRDPATPAPPGAEAFSPPPPAPSRIVREGGLDLRL